MGWPRVAASIVLATAIVAAAAAASVGGEADRLSARRVAIADAYRKLAEAVHGVRLDAETTLSDLAFEHDEIDEALDGVLRGVRVGEPRYLDDGTCEVPAELDVERIVEALREVRTRPDAGGRVITIPVDEVRTRIAQETLRVIGRGAARADLPPLLSHATLALLPAAGTFASIDEPGAIGVWSQVPGKARLMAVRAAELDARRLLAERVMGVRLTATTTVRDFATRQDRVSLQTETLRIGVATTQVYYHADELIVEVTLRLPAAQVRDCVRHFARRDGVGTGGAPLEIQTASDIVVTGMGMPPSDILDELAARRTTPHRPTWTTGAIRASGAADAVDDTAQGRLKARRAAVTQARANLAARVGQLELAPGVSVRDFVATRLEVSLRLDAALARATIEDTEFDAAAAHVNMAIPGVRVWNVVGGAYRQSGR